ncbi:MAG: beta-lactamase family protein [Alphaproteobacteria bacterium]|nr:beta-lactamase family protein [Alphaproteobacteria bacterium]
MQINRRGLVIGGAALAAIGVSPHDAAATAADKAAVESSLLTAVSVTNRPPVHMNIADRMARYAVPGASVAVMRNGRLAWSGAYGVRRAGGAPVTPSTVFQAASLSKPLTALAALRLADAGVVELEGDVNARLHNWRLPFAAKVPPQPITLSQLLSHTAGVSVEGFPGFKSDEKRPTLRAILDGAPEAKTPRIEVSEEPGPPRYSGGGYMVIEQLIEDLTRTNFTSHMKRSVLDLIGMQSSTFEPIPPPQLAADIASGHSWHGRLHDEDWLIYPQHAAASLWSTATDLALFLRALVAIYRGAPGALVKRKATRDMQSYIDSIMGLALETEHAVQDGQPITHSGWNTGYRSFIIVFPNTGDGVAVLTNADRGNDLAMEIVRAAARVYGWPTFAPILMEAATLSDQTFDAIAGIYDFPEAGIAVVLTREQDRLRLTAPRGHSILQPVRDQWPKTVTLYCIEDAQPAIVQANKGAIELLLWGMTGRRRAT